MTQSERLLAILRDLDRVAVAFSRGVDSSVVAMAAYQALQEKAVAVTLDGKAYESRSSTRTSPPEEQSGSACPTACDEDRYRILNA